MKGWADRLLNISGTDDLNLGWLPGEPLNFLNMKELLDHLKKITKQYDFSLLIRDRTLPSSIGLASEYKLYCDRHGNIILSYFSCV
jgi:hypothetical protein